MISEPEYFPAKNIAILICLNCSCTLVNDLEMVPSTTRETNKRVQMDQCESIHINGEGSKYPPNGKAIIPFSPKIKSRRLFIIKENRQQALSMKRSEFQREMASTKPTLPVF
jgi:hypothetical protein